MIPNIHQSIDEIILSSSPEQKILWQQVRLLTGENAAVRQLYYCGPLIGSEFATYDANKLYLAYQIEASRITLLWSVAIAAMQFFDENNVSRYMEINNSTLWNSTTAAPNNVSNSAIHRNIYFGRIDLYQYTHIKFIGYRLTR